MAGTHKLIGSVTVGAGGQAAIEFTNIPATYTDLLVKCSLRENSGSFPNDRIQFNGNTSNYSHRILSGSGSAAASYSGTNNGIDFVSNDSASETANTFSNNELYIPNYTSSNNKLVSADAVSENNATAAYALLTAGLWSNSSAITSIKLYSGGGNNFVQHSTAYLYGI